MSEVITFTLEAARKYNARAAKIVGWDGQIPEAAQEKYLGFRHAPDSVAFAGAVISFQEDVKASSKPDLLVDGKLGRNTWLRLVKTFAPVKADTEVYPNYFIHGGRRIPVPSLHQTSTQDYSLLTYEHPAGLDLRHDGGWTRSAKRNIKLIVIHWGGYSASHCRDALANRDLSSHFGVEKHIAYQWLPTDYVAYHVNKWYNTYSIGIDVCRHPLPSMLKHINDDPLPKVIEQDPPVRGERRIVELDDASARTLRNLVIDLCQVHNVPMRVPRGDAGLSLEGPVYHGVLPKGSVKRGLFASGVVGHHHLSKKKWDIAPKWWEKAFRNTALG